MSLGRDDEDEEREKIDPPPYPRLRPPSYVAEREYAARRVALFRCDYEEGARTEPESAREDGPPSSKIGYQHVLDNVYIGNYSAALAIVENFKDARKIKKFGAAFNASGSESDLRTSLHEKFAALGVEYDTMQNEEYGLTLGTAPLSNSSSAKFKKEEEKSRIVAAYPRKIWVPSRSHNSIAAFRSYMYAAADRIEILSKKNPERALLVYCVQGRNRAGSAAVAWLILKRRVRADLAIAFVQSGGRAQRNLQSVIDRQDFLEQLRTLDSARRPEHEREFRREISEEWAKNKNLILPTAEKCASCGRAGAPDKIKFFACAGGCSPPALYCSRECQRTHASAHRADCPWFL